MKASLRLAGVDEVGRQVIVKQERVSRIANPLLFLVGDTGFEPVTPAV